MQKAIAKYSFHARRREKEEKRERERERVVY